MVRVLSKAWLMGVVVIAPSLSGQTVSASDSIRIVVADRALDIGRKNFPLVEPSLAVHPRNPQHLLVGVIVEKKPDMSDADCAAAMSTDGGTTWSTHDFGLKECGDPFVAFNPDGSAVISVLGPDGSLLTYTSSDGGKTWGAPVNHPGSSHDHGVLAVDHRTGGTNTRSVYLTSQIQTRDTLGHSRAAVYIARSDDGGKSFGAPIRHIATNVSLTSMSPVVLSDGTLLVSYSDYGRTMSDGQFSWVTGRDWILESRDGGKTFGSPAMITDVCARTFPVLRADTASAKFKDRVYWICNDGTFQKIWLHTSSDRGERWSDPIQVNRGSTRQPYVRTPAMGVNRTGAVLFSWYDGRATGSRYRQIYRCQEFFVTASLDGGQTFLPELKVSTARNCPDTPANGESGRRWPAGGDYTGLASDSNGRFHLVWPDSRGGLYQLRYALVEVGK